VEGWKVWWLLFGLCFFSFIFGRIVTYLWVSHRISLVKFCGGGFKKWSTWCVWLWSYLSHSHCNLVSDIVRMYALVWSYILVSVPCICVVGLVVIISLYGLHSLVVSVRCGAMMNGWMNLWSLYCTKFIYELYVV
jgi:hypothetical protein